MDQPSRPDQDPGFLSDAGAAVRAWFSHPFLPVLSVLIWAAPVLLERRGLGALTLPFTIFAVGLPGTERVWYLRAFRGLEITGAQVWDLTWAFFGRFLVLGLLLFGLPLVAGGIVAAATRSVGPFVTGLVAYSLVADVMLTFVTPALAFTSARVREALPMGIRMIRRSWPHDVPYVFIPAFALIVLGRALPQTSVGLLGAFGASVVATLLSLTFKGATAAFYLRRHPTGDTGAAYARQDRRQASPGDEWEGRGLESR